MLEKDWTLEAPIYTATIMSSLRIARDLTRAAANIREAAQRTRLVMADLTALSKSTLTALDPEGAVGIARLAESDLDAALKQAIAIYSGDEDVDGGLLQLALAAQLGRELVRKANLALAARDFGESAICLRVAGQHLDEFGRKLLQVCSDGTLIAVDREDGDLEIVVAN